MIGAIAGDIIGSRFEFKIDREKSKDFELFPDVPACTWTDDTVMTLATAAALMDAYLKCKFSFNKNFEKALIKRYKEFGNKYPDAGYGAAFRGWLISDDNKPYNSFGNGSAMRVSPCVEMAKSLKEVIRLATISASVTHNHPEGIKGAVVTAGAAYLAKRGATKEEIREFVSSYYDISFTLDEIRPFYHFEASCQNSVPQAVVCFLESDSYEDCIRNVVSIGGDSDTQGAIAGSIAEFFYGVPEDIKNNAYAKLDNFLKEIYDEFTFFALCINPRRKK